MRDWKAMVDQRTRELGLDAERESEIRDELASHLADAYDDAIRLGHTEDEAFAMATGQPGDWRRLVDRLRQVESREDSMRDRMRTLWVPGLAMLACAGALLIGIGWFFPGEWWANRDVGADRTAAAGVLLFYAALGACGAAWSRRAGGRREERIGAALLPLALHIMMVVPVLIVSALLELERHPQGHVNPQLRVILVMILAPGLALAVGAAPFVRDDAH